jgi:hypothetical protein
MTHLLSLTFSSKIPTKFSGNKGELYVNHKKKLNHKLIMTHVERLL